MSNFIGAVRSFSLSKKSKKDSFSFDSVPRQDSLSTDSLRSNLSNTSGSESSTSNSINFTSHRTRTTPRVSRRALHMMPHDGLVKVMMIGECAVGKSCLVQRFVQNDFDINMLSTIGMDLALKMLDIDGKRIKVQVWDTAGQEKYRVITKGYLRGAHCFAVVFSLIERETFDKLVYWLNTTRQTVIDPDIPTVLIGNKLDMDNERSVSFEEAQAFADRYGMQYFETSAKTGENVNEAFETLIRGRMVLETKCNKTSTTVTLRPGQTSPRKRCCK